MEVQPPCFRLPRNLRLENVEREELWRRAIFVLKSTGAYDPVAQAAADAMRGAGQIVLVHLALAAGLKKRARGLLAAGLLQF